MPREQRINLFYWLAAAALAVALMPAPDLIHDLPITYKWGFSALCLLMAAVFFGRAVFLTWQDEATAPKLEKKRKMIALIGMAVCGVGFLGFSGYYFWPTEQEKTATTRDGPLSGLTTAQLRERTLSFTQTLRTFEGSFQASERALQEKAWSNRRQVRTPEAVAEANAIDGGAMERRAKFRDEYMARYRTEAALLREALRQKLGKLPDPPATHPFGEAAQMAGRDIFEGALLAGPAPLAAGSDLLEYWARHL